MIRVLAIPFAILVLLVGSIVWSGGGTERRADFAFFNRGDIITLDPRDMSYIQDFRVSYGMREGLYSYDSKTLEPVPAGCIRSEISEDKRVYTFHLRPEAKWNNGDPVVATDYVFAWRRMLEEPGEYTYLFDAVKGAKKYGTDFSSHNKYLQATHAHQQDPRRNSKPQQVVERPDFSSVGIEALSTHALRVTLNEPTTFWLDLMAFVPFYPLHAPSMQEFRQVDDVTGQVTYRTEFTRPGNVVTNGPYDFVRWDFKRRLLFKKSETYWDKANVFTDTIEMVVNDDPLSQFLAYDAGDVDWNSDVQTSFAADLKSKGRTDVRAMPVFGTAFLSFNCLPEFLPGTSGASGKNPLSDKRVRQALALAIDRQYIVDNVTRMGEPVALNYIPPNVLPGWQSKPGFGLDVQRARKLLAEAGYPGGKGLPRFPIVFNSDNPTRKSLSQVLKNQWQANLGVEVDIQGLELKSYRTQVTEKKYAIAPVAWYGDYMDASTFTDKYLSTSLQNDTGWGNEQYDGLCLKGTTEPDVEKRLRILESAEALLLEEAPIVPIYVYVHVWMHRDHIKGIYPNPKVQMMFKGLKVEKAS